MLVSVSCRRERFESPKPVDNDAISFLVKEANPLATKSEKSLMELIFSEDSLELYLDVTESDMCAVLPDSSDVNTKGAPYSGDNIGDFYVTAFLHADASTPYFEDIALNSDGSVVGTGYYWPITTPPTQISFFAYAKNSSSGTLSSRMYDPVNSSGSFDYVLPDPSADVTSAVEQPDLLFAVAPSQVNTGSAVALNFHHALSSIVFRVGDIPADFIVEKVEFTDIPTQGSCEYVSDSDGNLSFIWNSSDLESFTQEFVKHMSDGEGVVADENVNESSQTFMMIPGNISDASEMVITVSIYKGESTPKNTYVIRKNLKSLLATWKAGKQYTYRISSPEEIEVEVDDDVVENGTKKENLEIRNTGLATSYMRAILVGYWVVPGATEEEDVIVGQWDQPAIDVDDPDADGDFVQAADFADNWIVGDDGFYYYKHPVPPGETTSDLFTSYTLTGVPPVVAAELVLSIAVQAVIHTKIGETTWPVQLSSDGVTLEKK